MLCTIQEAYNIPSFDGVSKKKRSCHVQAKASADAYDPYNPAENGRGQRPAASALVESFQVGPGKSMSQEETPVTYRGKANDYEYYRKNYNVQLPVIEGFQQCTGNSESAQMYKVPISDEAKDMYDNAMNTTLDETVPKYVPTPMEPRKVDMSNVSGYYDEELEQYLQTKDMKAAPFSHRSSMPSIQPATMEPMANVNEYKSYKPFDQEPPPDAPKTRIYSPDDAQFPKAPSRTNCYKSHKPYDSDTLIQKLSQEETKIIAHKKVNDNTRAKPNDEVEGEEVVVAKPKQRTIISQESWQSFWDMFLFIFAGILVMFLCEQLFKLAIMIGMKRTVEILEPFLSKEP